MPGAHGQRLQDQELGDREGHRLVAPGAQVPRRVEHQIATRNRHVYNINVASDTLIGALHDPRTKLVKLALQGLSLLALSDNQQAIGDYALDGRMPMELRLIALDRL